MPTLPTIYHGFIMSILLPFAIGFLAGYFLKPKIDNLIQKVKDKL